MYIGPIVTSEMMLRDYIKQLNTRTYYNMIKVEKNSGMFVELHECTKKYYRAYHTGIRILPKGRILMVRTTYHYTESDVAKTYVDLSYNAKVLKRRNEVWEKLLKLEEEE